MNTLYSQRYLARLDRFLADHKVEIVRYVRFSDWLLALEDADHPLSQAPFTQNLAIQWESKQLHFFGTQPWPSLLHEAGHILCSKVPPNHRDADDISFLGWELAVMKHLQLPMKHWHKSNDEYGISGGEWQTPEDNYDEIGQLPFGKAPFKRFVRYYVEDARQRGLVAEDGTPLCY